MPDINYLLAQLDNARRGMGRNIGNALTNPMEAMSNALARYASESLPTRMDVQDSMSVMPGMGDPLSAKLNALATNSMMPLGTVLKIPANRLGWPSTHPRVLVDRQAMDLESLGPQERLLANMYATRLGSGMNPDDAAKATAVWGLMHPQIGSDYVNAFLPRLSPAPVAEVLKLRGR